MSLPTYIFGICIPINPLLLALQLQQIIHAPMFPATSSPSVMSPLFIVSVKECHQDDARCSEHDHINDMQGYILSKRSLLPCQIMAMEL